MGFNGIFRTNAICTNANLLFFTVWMFDMSDSFNYKELAMSLQSRLTFLCEETALEWRQDKRKPGQKLGYF